jgi:hypothetical protein
VGNGKKYSCFECSSEKCEENIFFVSELNLFQVVLKNNINFCSTTICNTSKDIETSREITYLSKTFFVVVCLVNTRRDDNKRTQDKGIFSWNF